MGMAALAAAPPQCTEACFGSLATALRGSEGGGGGSGVQGQLALGLALLQRLGRVSRDRPEALDAAASRLLPAVLEAAEPHALRSPLPINEALVQHLVPFFVSCARLAAKGSPAAWLAASRGLLQATLVPGPARRHLFGDLWAALVLSSTPAAQRELLGLLTRAVEAAAAKGLASTAGTPRAAAELVMRVSMQACCVLQRAVVAAERQRPGAAGEVSSALYKSLVVQWGGIQRTGVQTFAPGARLSPVLGLALAHQCLDLGAMEAGLQRHAAMHLVPFALQRLRDATAALSAAAAPPPDAATALHCAEVLVLQYSLSMQRAVATVSWCNAADQAAFVDIAVQALQQHHGHLQQQKQQEAAVLGGCLDVVAAAVRGQGVLGFPKSVLTGIQSLRPLLPSLGSHPATASRLGALLPCFTGDSVLSEVVESVGAMLRSNCLPVVAQAALFLLGLWRSLQPGDCARGIILDLLAGSREGPDARSDAERLLGDLQGPNGGGAGTLPDWVVPSLAAANRDGMAALLRTASGSRSGPVARDLRLAAAAAAEALVQLQETLGADPSAARALRSDASGGKLLAAIEACRCLLH